MGMLEVVDGVSFVDTDHPPFIPMGYGLGKNHGSYGLVPLSADHIELWSPVQEYKREMTGLEVMELLHRKRLANSNVLQALLYAERTKIPDSWKGKRIYFLGTEYVLHKRPYVRYLLEHPSIGWTWNSEFLGFLWGEDCYVALLAW